MKTNLHAFLRTWMLMYANDKIYQILFNLVKQLLIFNPFILNIVLMNKVCKCIFCEERETYLS